MVRFWRLELAAHERVDRLVGAHLRLDDVEDLPADAACGSSKNSTSSSWFEVVQDQVGEVDDLLAGQLHRTMPFSLAIFFLSILNISV